MEIRELKKNYGRQLAVDSVSYVFSSGIYALLEPNGAGKTTLINMIMGSVKPDGGDILYHGTSLIRDRRMFVSDVGYLPQSPRFYQDFSVVEFLQYVCELKALPNRIRNIQFENVLRKVNLGDEGGKRIGSLSGGMRQRLGIAQALIGDPKVLIFDEPTAGLDPIERIRFRNLISQFSNEKMIIIATHIVPDVEFIAKRIVLMNSGVIITSGRPENLNKQIQGKVWSVDCSFEDVNQLVDRFRISSIQYEVGNYSLRIVSNIPPTSTARQVTPRLEEAYIYFTEGLD